MCQISKIDDIFIHRDNRGCLMAVEGLPFIHKRVFFVYDSPKYIHRGDHAHKKNLQYFVCIKGKILVSLHDGKNEQLVELTEGKGVFVDVMVWSKQQYNTGNDILAVFCSEKFEKEDYICDYKQFIELKNGKSLEYNTGNN